MLNKYCVALPSVYFRPLHLKELFWAICKDFELAFTVPLRQKDDNIRKVI